MNNSERRGASAAAGEASGGDAGVLVERRGAVAEVTLSHPSALNAMTWGMYERLQAICDELDDDDGVRVVVLQGAGSRAFVAGTDIAQFRAFKAAGDGIAYEERLDHYVGRVERLAKPSIAKLRGVAAGGGASLALACDLRIAAPSLRFGVPIARTLGNCLSAQTLSRIVDIIGPARARQLLYTAELLDAETCLRFGAVNEVVPEADLDGRVEALAAQIASHAPLTLQATKQTLARILEGRRLERDDDSVRLCYGSRDFHEGVESFLAKRPARWQGV